LPKKHQASTAAIRTIEESIITFTLSNGWLKVLENASTVISADSIQALACTSMLTPTAVIAHPPTSINNLTHTDSG